MLYHLKKLSLSLIMRFYENIFISVDLYVISITIYKKYFFFRVRILKY